MSNARSKRRRAAVVALSAWITFSGIASAGAATIGESDFARVITVASPAIAPDGKRAIALVKRILWDDDKRSTDLIAIDLATGAQQTLLPHRAGLSDPAFSPDGTQIAFLADDAAKDSHSQIFVMPSAGGAPHQVTSGKADVEQFAWRPDGAAFAYAASDPDPDRTGSDRFRDSFIFTTEPIVARESPQPIHLFTIAARGGESEQLTSGSQSVASGEAESTLSWSPDGTAIAFTLVPNAILNDQSYSRVAVVDVATHGLRTITGNAAWEEDPRFSPDGAHIAYACAKGDPQINLSELCVTTPQGGTGHPISTVINRPLADAAWLPGSKGLLAVVPDRASIALYRISLDGRATRVETGSLELGSALDGAVAADGTMVFVGSNVKQPPELFARSPDGAMKQLTNFNASIASLDLASAQRITFTSAMGIEGDGVLYYPPEYRTGTKYPLVVYIHGGPTSSSTLAFNFWAQVMAARGWLVLQPNYRGSDDLGITYQRAVLYDLETGPGKDIMAALDSVRARGIVDGSRIAVCGWSYGGIMTAWMISKYHIWRAAVSGASVNDWITDYGTADDSLSDADLFHGSPFVGSNAAEWRRASAISYAADVTTPVLILSDVGDNRDSFATSSMYWRALRDNHKDATLRVWPVNGHFPSDPVRSADVYHYWIEYIAAHFQR
jgi:dipeptidyl aminopeptidase/acylaminoacyl peptidase